MMTMSLVFLFGLAITQHMPIERARMTSIIRSVSSARNPLDSNNEKTLDPIIMATIKQAKTEKKKIVFSRGRLKFSSSLAFCKVNQSKCRTAKLCILIGRKYKKMDNLKQKDQVRYLLHELPPRALPFFVY